MLPLIALPVSTGVPTLSASKESVDTIVAEFKVALEYGNDINDKLPRLKYVIASSRNPNAIRKYAEQQLGKMGVSCTSFDEDGDSPSTCRYSEPKDWMQRLGLKP